jgi:hypothetical protein
MDGIDGSIYSLEQGIDILTFELLSVIVHNHA